MTDTAIELNAEFDAWFVKVQALSETPLDPSEDWAELWFNGYTPEEAIEDDIDDD